MASDRQETALAEARKHAQKILHRCQRAYDAHVYGNSDEVGRHLRALESNCDDLSDAHDSLERALDPPPELPDAIANPTGHMGAQVSNGQAPRDY